MHFSGAIRSFLDFLAGYKDTLAVVSSTVALIAVGFKASVPIKQGLSAWDARRRLKDLIGARSYTSVEVRAATRFYLRPDCQSVDPSGSEDFRALYPVRAPLFRSIDELLLSDAGHRHTIVLADSGMGKSSFVLNYYAHHVRNHRREFDLVLIPLGSREAETQLVSLRSRTDQDRLVVILDAFDEDTRAINDYRARIGQLLGYTEGCRHVLITCRTQFFLRDDEVPKETGILRVGITRAGQSKEYQFYKIYLSPFSNEQIRSYLRRRLPVWRWRDRRLAFEICRRISDLAVRPMLLEHIPTLLTRGSDWRYASQVYEEMVLAWVKRERSFFPEDGEGGLLDFSERLAVDLYLNRSARGSEAIDSGDLEPLAVRFGLHLRKWQLTGRSLLNRTADGRYKFAHRSILEYLFVRRFLSASAEFSPIQWTDQMKRFLIESILIKIQLKESLLSIHFESADLEGWGELGWGATLELSAETKTSPQALVSMGRIPDATMKKVGMISSVMAKFSFGDIRTGSDESARKQLQQEGSALSGGITLADYRATYTVDWISNCMWAKLPLAPLDDFNLVRENIDLCNTALLSGFGDWRLPSRTEFRTLIGRHKFFEGIILRGVWCDDTREPQPVPIALGLTREEDRLVTPGSLFLVRQLYSDSR